MNALDRIDKKNLKEFLSKGWITHDAMWYYSAVRECGIEVGNKLNLTAIQMMAPFEVKRVKKILGASDKFESFDELVEFIRGAHDLIIPDFMKTSLTVPELNVIAWEWEKEGCFAYKGIKEIGIIEGYRCGVMHRINCWYDSLGLKYQVDPKIEGCLMHSQGSCHGTYRFFFDK